MNKLTTIIAALLCLCTQVIHPADVVFTLAISKERQADIHANVVKYTGLGKTKPDNYHVTIAHVDNVHLKDKKALQGFLKSELKKIVKNGKIWPAQFVKGGRYVVGGRTYNNCPIVLYPSKGTAAILKTINAHLSNMLSHFKAPSKKVYKHFARDLQPIHFTPHITLANTIYINKVGADRDAVIGKIARNLKKYAQAQKKLKKTGTYALALRIA